MKSTKKDVRPYSEVDTTSRPLFRVSLQKPPPRLAPHWHRLTTGCVTKLVLHDLYSYFARDRLKSFAEKFVSLLPNVGHIVLQCENVPLGDALYNSQDCLRRFNPTKFEIRNYRESLVEDINPGRWEKWPIEAFDWTRCDTTLLHHRLLEQAA